MDQITDPVGGALAVTMTSAEAEPPMIVTCPGTKALNTGGLSVERLRTVGSLVVQVSPKSGWPVELKA